MQGFWWRRGGIHAGELWLSFVCVLVSWHCLPPSCRFIKERSSNTSRRHEQITHSGNSGHSDHSAGGGWWLPWLSRTLASSHRHQPWAAPTLDGWQSPELELCLAQAVAITPFLSLAWCLFTTGEAVPSAYISHACLPTIGRFPQLFLSPSRLSASLILSISVSSLTLTSFRKGLTWQFIESHRRPVWIAWRNFLCTNSGW